MGLFLHKFEIDVELKKIWNFYTDLHHLEIITPKSINLKIINFNNKKIYKGQEVWIEGKIIIKQKWHSKITLLENYQYVDEMLSGPFKKWRHRHTFIALDSNKTEIIDEIEFELPFGRLGKFFEFYAIMQLKKIFENRKIATTKYFS